MTAPTSSRRPCRSTTATSTPGSASIGATGGPRSGASARDRAAVRHASHFLIDSSASLLYQGSGTSPQNSTERAVPSSGSRFSGGAPSERRASDEHPGGVWEVPASQEADRGPARRDLPRLQGGQ